ncbi:MAG: Zn-ribbon domain-containing OB-fold protein [Acidimicrobiales bacterium]
MPDDRSAGFWEAAAEHVLAIQRCTRCGFYHHPPVDICHGCLSPERSFRYEPVSGRATVRTWTVVRDAFLAGFAPDVPYVLAEAELDEQAGLRLVLLLVDGDESGMRLGLPVEAVFDDVTPGVSVPHFRAAVQS